MSATIECKPCCVTPPPVNIPGISGADGESGADGVDSFTTTTADFIIPAIGASVVVPVVQALWPVIGQVVVFDGPANFQVISLPTATSMEVEFLGYAQDLSPGATISAGAKVGPGGVQPFVALTGSDTLDFGSTAAQTSADLTIAVSGCAEGDPVALAVPAASVENDSCYTAFVSAADTVTVRFNNFSAGSIDPASGTFVVIVFKV